MYFPTSAARRLSSAPAFPADSEPVTCLCASPRRSLFCTLTKSGLSVWRTRPTATLAHLARTPASLDDHGDNVTVTWAPNGRDLVIQTSKSYLVLVSLEYVQDETPYESSSVNNTAQRHFQSGPGEAVPLVGITLHLEGAIRIDGGLLSVSPRNDCILFSTRSPPTVHRIPWPSQDGRANGHQYFTWNVDEQEFPWLEDHDVAVTKIIHSRTIEFDTWITSDGRAYLVELYVPPDEQLGYSHQRDATDDSATTVDEPHLQWQGTCIHRVEPPRWVQKRRRTSDLDAPYVELRRAMTVAINARFSLIAVGTLSGAIELTNFPSEETMNPKAQVLQVPTMYTREGPGPVCAMEWSSDGYVLAVGWQNGWGIWSVGGRCLAWGFGTEHDLDKTKFQDTFMFGIKDLVCLSVASQISVASQNMVAYLTTKFWAPGNFELAVLANDAVKDEVDGQLFIMPFAKSAITGQPPPDSTQYAFLHMDDRVLVYRGADQPDMSVINPESDVWQHIKIPEAYMASNWPIRYSSLSSDGRFIAIAGRRGLVHYSSTSGRWKIFADELQEQAFTVRGGMLWFHHVLIAAVDISGTYQIRLYSRDLELANQNVLHRELLSSPAVILSLVDNSLLVYTADNTLYHYLVVPTAETISLHLCGSINFEGVIVAPSAVRMLSWMIPNAQKQLGDPSDDLSVATVLMIVGGRLVLLRPRRSGDQEVKYDMRILSDRIEFAWIHLRGIGTLENSLWGYDGQGIRLWMNALNIESVASPNPAAGELERVKESVNIPLDFYPLSALMDKGIIVGVEYEVSTRPSVSFAVFRHTTSSHLFLHHVLQYHLENGQLREAVLFASHYQHLVYFAHALEILLHTVVEEDASLTHDDAKENGVIERRVLPITIDFLDHFDVSLDVVVGCARKIEMDRWPRLFETVGDPKALFEACLESNRLKTAGSYLLVLHNLDHRDADGISGDGTRLLRSAIAAKDWQLCREILRFLHSVDDSGTALRSVLAELELIPQLNGSH